MNGLSFYICVGKYGGWRFGFDGPALRAVLGWIAIGITLRDIERDLGTLLDVLNEGKEKDKAGVN